MRNITKNSVWRAGSAAVAGPSSPRRRAGLPLQKTRTRNQRYSFFAPLVLRPPPRYPGLRFPIDRLPPSVISSGMTFGELQGPLCAAAFRQEGKCDGFAGCLYACTISLVVAGRSPCVLKQTEKGVSQGGFIAIHQTG